MSEATPLRDATAETETAPEDGGAALPNSRGRLGRHAKRVILLVLLPLLVVAAAIYAYLHSGRYASTDNAYVQADIVHVAAEVSGVITSLAVVENQRVAAGEELFRLQAESFEIALQSAAASVAQAESDIEANKQEYRQAQAELDLHRAAAEFAETQLTRQQGLREGQLGTVQDLDAAQYSLDAALRQIAVAEQRAASVLARLNGDAEAPVDRQPRYLRARALLDQAELDVARCVIRAPFAGVVTNRPRLGAFVERGVPVVAVVADENMWVEANFKETQMAHIRLQQLVEVKVDSYPGQIWRGRVESISEATGAEFALLPPQNATGNWVKIVQRIPLRVTLEPQPHQPPLRVGMSSTVTVDTGYARSWRDLVPSG